MDVSGMIDALTMNGYKVKINHLRSTREHVEWALAERRAGHKLAMPAFYPKHTLRAHGIEIDPRSGRTIAAIWQGDNLLASGIATCSPCDQFRKAEGSVKALGRAIASLPSA